MQSCWRKLKMSSLVNRLLGLPLGNIFPAILKEAASIQRSYGIACCFAAGDNFCKECSISLKESPRRETMPLLDQAAKWTTNKMPKVITPKAHAIIDYAMAASFFGMAAFFWRRNKRAAVSALVCGAAEAITALCTDYPGGVVKEISYETHGTIDFGLSGMVASLPDMLRFADEPESRFFRMQGLGLATVTGLTDFTGTGEGDQLQELDRRSA
jgi:hypothetical protein